LIPLEGRVEATEPMVFSGDETTDLGSDTATPVSDDYNPKTSAFSGRVRWVQIDLLSAVHLAEGDELRTEVGGVGRAARAADRHGRRWLGRQAGDGLGQRPAPFAGGSGPGLTGGVSLHHPGSHH
jgi:hypothetical protein